MTIDWYFLLASVLLLWLPPSLLYPPAARKRLSGQNFHRYRFQSLFLTWQHWLDALRGFVGAYFLIAYAVPAVEAGGARGAAYEAFALQAIVLAIAVILQTIQYRKVVYSVAPVAFLIGLSFVLSNWQAALFATVFGLLLVMVKNLELKFPLMAVLLGIAGYLIGGVELHLLLNCTLFALPVVLTYLTQTNFVIYTRELVR